MKIVAWVDVYPWNLRADNPPNTSLAQAVGGKRYRIDFEVPDPVDIDGNGDVQKVEEVHT